MKNWWKILGVILMIYVLCAGFLIPLKPGIYDINPRRITLGDNAKNKVTVQTYNAHLDKATDNNVWLKTPNDDLIKASDVSVVNHSMLQATFGQVGYIPKTESSTEYTLIIDNAIDGYIFYPDAIKLDGLTTHDNPLQTYPLSQLKRKDLFAFPYLNLLHETIRNTFFHVAIWFAMFILLLISCYHSIRYLITKDIYADIKSSSMTTVGLYFGIAGILTGSMWARFTWGTFWTTDIKLNMSATAMLVYLAYWILRSSISDRDTKARLSSVYNVFAFICLMFLVMVVPRMSETDSMHPGNGGNPALGGEDLDNTLRTVFYPAIFAYTLIGYWMAQLYSRYMVVKDKFEFGNFD